MGFEVMLTPMKTLIAAGLLVGMNAYGQTADKKTSAALQDARNWAQQVMAVNEERELAVKKGVAEVVNKAVKTASVRIFGNEITVSVQYPSKWLQRHMDAYATEIACYALLTDGVEAEKAHGQPMYQYVHVIISDSERTAGESIVKLSDYPTVDALMLAFKAALKQDKIDSHEPR
jgi:hypothetical protein